MTATVTETKTVRGVTLRQDPAREPCFTVVHTDAEMAEWPDMSEPSRRERLHRQMNNELGVLEIAAQSLADFPETAWDLKLSLARQCFDESRHALSLLRRLQELGGAKGEFPIANFEWGVTLMLDNLPGRLAIENRTFEAGLIDILGQMRHVWREHGDDTTAELFDAILADEITHVRFANRWIKRMTEDDPRILLKVALAIRYLRTVNAAVMPQPGEINAVGVTIPEKTAPAVNVEGRREAEFSQEEILEVLRQAGFRSIIPDDVK